MGADSFAHLDKRSKHHHMRSNSRFDYHWQPPSACFVHTLFTVRGGVFESRRWLAHLIRQSARGCGERLFSPFFSDSINFSSFQTFDRLGRRGRGLGGHEGRFSRDPFRLISAGGACEQSTSLSTINKLPGFEWQTAISQSTRANETHHSFVRQSYPTVQNHPPFDERSLTEGARLNGRERERKTVPNTRTPPQSCRTWRQKTEHSVSWQHVNSHHSSNVSWRVSGAVNHAPPPPFFPPTIWWTLFYSDSDVAPAVDRPLNIDNWPSASLSRLLDIRSDSLTLLSSEGSGAWIVCAFWRLLLSAIPPIGNWVGLDCVIHIVLAGDRLSRAERVEFRLVQYSGLLNLP